MFSYHYKWALENQNKVFDIDTSLLLKFLILVLIKRVEIKWNSIYAYVIKINYAYSSC